MKRLRDSGPVLWWVVLATLGVLASPARAQAPATVTVDDVRVRGHGRHELVVSVLDASGLPVAGLEDAFRITVDGTRAEGQLARPGRSGQPVATVTLIADAALFAGSTLADLQAAVRDLAAELKPNDELRVIGVGGRARARQGAARDAERLVGGFGAMAEPDPPRLYDALVDAVRASSHSPANRGSVVLVVSRGADGGSRHGAVDVLALARARSRLTPIQVILLGDRGQSPEGERLRQLAASAGGAFTEATSLYGIGPVLAGLAKRGLDSWRVSFTVPGWKRSEPKHHMSMVVTREGARRTADRDYETADVLPARWWTTPLPWLLLGLLLAAATTAWFLTRRRQSGLLVHDGDSWDGVWYELFAFPISIGGAAGNDLVLGDAQVSRNHAVLERRGRVVELADLNSENGSFVNGERVTRRVLADGDRLSFGRDVHMIYEARG